MKFLILTQYFLPEIGAPQVRLAAVVQQLLASGHEVEVVTALPNHPTGRILPPYRGRFYMRDAWQGATVHRVWLYAAKGAGLKRLLNYISFCLTCLWGLLRSQRPDYLFVESPPLFLAWPAVLASRLWRAKLIFNVADLWPDSVSELGLMRRGLLLRLAEGLERWAYRKAYRINAVTEGIWTTLVEKKGVPAEKLLFMPNGADTTLFRPRPASGALAEQWGVAGYQLFVYAGTHGYAHGLETVLEAARLLADRPDLLILLIGDGSEKERLMALAEAWGLKNVRFIPPQPLEEIAALYSLTLAGLAVVRDLPIMRGGRSSKAFPVMAAGVPVIYSGAGEGAHLIEEAGAGLVVPPEQPEALAEAMLRLSAEPALAARLGHQGRSYMLTHLSWQGLVAKWLGQLEPS